MSKHFLIFDQIFDWFLNVFAKVISFLSDKVLFGLSLLSFVEDSFHLVFLIGCYFDFFLRISIDFDVGSNKKI